MTTDSVKTLLIIEDNPGDARLLREMLKEGSTYLAELLLAGTMAEAEKCLLVTAVDIILMDLGLPDSEGLAAIRRVRAAAPGIPLVVLTGMDDEAMAAQSLQEGAQDYLIKGQIETRGLLRALRYATERKRLERLKDEFVSTVSHELRTPLTSIAGSLGLLMGNVAGELSKPAARLLEIAHSNSERLVRLVNDILDIEKLESGRVTFNLRRVEVRVLVKQAVEEINDFAAARGVDVQLTDFGNAVTYVRADSDRLVQVMTNLLSNAVKFSAPENAVVVAVDARENPDVVRFSVRDHGPGIPLEFRPRIFERFAQADATNARRKGGTGLGLSIAKQIVDRLGGTVGFDDAPGGGTVFYVELPRWNSNADIAREGQIEAALPEEETTLVNLLEEARDCMPLVPAQDAQEVI
jgi:signal transduction histidine kinase